MENTVSLSWKSAEKKYIEFLENRCINSRTEPVFYFHRKHSFFIEKDRKEIYRILEELTD